MSSKPTPPPRKAKTPAPVQTTLRKNQIRGAAGLPYRTAKLKRVFKLAR